MASGVTRRIEAIVEGRLGGTARLTPSARVGLIAALHAFFERGDRIAMIAPLCEVVSFSAYAAGVRPVFVDSCVDAPCIDVQQLAKLDRGAVAGVVAANLYGRPDDLPELRALCRERKWTLIEDAAQILDSYVEGEPAGTFGDATVLSFMKYFDEECGAVVCRDARRQADVDAQVARWSVAAERKARWRARILKLARGAGLERAERLLRSPDRTDPLTPLDPRNTRVPMSPAQLLAVVQAPGDLMESMDRFLRLDNARYRLCLPPARLERLAGKLAGWDRLAQTRRAAGRRIADAVRRAGGELVDDGDGVCFLAVPMIAHDRDAVVAHLWATEGLRVETIYNPPLPQWLPTDAFTDCREFPERDERWSRNLVPLPTAQAERVERALESYRSPRPAEARSEPAVNLGGTARVR